ncbi:MAG TPA: hypothetical protein PKY59_15420 [Pyrinomonadaceae bacterium]|nr:hypothetical protein [Pyrinomonadaceae bacterium]
MKKHIFLLYFVTFLLAVTQSVFGQEADKSNLKAEKEQQKLAEKQEKERLKKPAQIEIGAPSEDIGKMLVNIFKAKNYKIDQSGKRKIMMSLIPAQINSQTASGGIANYKIIISLDEKDGKTKVTINVGMLAPDSFGRIAYTNLDSDKKTRAEIDAILVSVKEKIEGK